MDIAHLKDACVDAVEGGGAWGGNMHPSREVLVRVGAPGGPCEYLPVSYAACSFVDGSFVLVLQADPPEGDHFVTFDEEGWFVRHSMACRARGEIGTCAYNDSIRAVADEVGPMSPGTWRIAGVDSEGRPSLERARV